MSSVIKYHEGFSLLSLARNDVSAVFSPLFPSWDSLRFQSWLLQSIKALLPLPQSFMRFLLALQNQFGMRFAISKFAFQIYIPAAWDEYLSVLLFVPAVIWSSDLCLQCADLSNICTVRRSASGHNAFQNGTITVHDLSVHLPCRVDSDVLVVES